MLKQHVPTNLGFGTRATTEPPTRLNRRRIHQRALQLGVIVAIALASSTGAQAAVALPLTLEDLAVLADRVVVATIVDQRSEWDATGKRIYTHYRLEVAEDIGEIGATDVVLTQPGGMVGDIGQVTFGYASFKVGDRRMLFLAGGQSRYRIVGMSQGVFDLQTTEKGEMVVQRLEHLLTLGRRKGPLVIPFHEAVERIRIARQTAR